MDIPISIVFFIICFMICCIIIIMYRLTTERKLAKAICSLEPGSFVYRYIKGVVYFDELSDGNIHVHGKIIHLSPGKHGLHVHEKGNIVDGCTSMKGHFNPNNSRHGDRGDKARHVGDLGNIVADETGTAIIDFVDEHIKLRGKNNIIGRGLVIHADEDDLKTDPDGKAGVRVACGIIGIN